MTKTNQWGPLATAAGALVAVGLLVLIMVVVEARPAGATFPGTPGKIAYYGYDGDAEIYTIKPGGGSKVKLTENARGNYDPTYSPSGKKIVYAVDDGNDDEIRTIKPGGGGRFNVTDNGENDNDPSWGSS
jgi:hypothetical protein